MFNYLKTICFFIPIVIGCIYCIKGDQINVNIITNYTVNLVKMQHSVIFACSQTVLMRTTKALLKWNKLVQSININISNRTLESVLTKNIYAKTSVIVDCCNKKSTELISEASNQRYFNKTYQWLLWDSDNVGIDEILPFNLDYLGPNAQVAYVNGSSDIHFMIWDLHSKGLHLRSPLEINLIATVKTSSTSDQIDDIIVHEEICRLQSIHYRSQFNGLTLRGATVIDLDNITTNEQIERVLSRPTKNSGVSAFTKYHYELLRILRERFNFTVNYRNARGWASRLGNSRFRLGFLGIIMRNEADVGASGIFNRINRFAEFDTIHQGWKFETAFLYRFTPDLDTKGKSGNFLAPFDMQVWFFAGGTLFAVSLIWRLIEKVNKTWRIKTHIKRIQQNSMQRKHNKNTQQRQEQQQQQKDIKRDDKMLNIDNESSLTGILLKAFAAVCQQGMDPIPKGLPSRTVILTIFTFSVVMYNYYTSSVVGGLLSSTAAGPSTVDEVVTSSLKLSFEDIGYYKVLFRENKSPIVTRLLSHKIFPLRDAADLPIYAHLEDAIPYLKNGSYAFHCEVVDAYPEIAKHFDANEICDLRVVSGLMETEIMNWVIHKNSQYTEIFRIAMCRARETGLIERLLRQRQPRKPLCQSLYTVYPVALSGVTSAFILLCGGFLLSSFTLFIEMYSKKYGANIKGKYLKHRSTI